MAQRLRLYDIRNSRFPRVNGLCQADTPEIADRANSAQRSLLYCKEAGDEGWQGTFAEVGFELSRSQPYITLPREIARLESATVCDNAIAVENQFIQYLQFGNGRLSKDRLCNNRRCVPSVLQAVSRNNAVTFVDLSTPPQYLRMYISDARDVGKRVLLQGKDSNDVTVYSTDNFVEVTGIFVALAAPFVTSTLQWNSLTGIQKDITYAPVSFYQVDPTTGDEVLLLTMDPGETTASYRRYFFNNLPCGCCPDPANADSPVQVTAIAKLDLIPMVVDTDYALLGNLEALILESQAIKYSESDSPAAKSMAQNAHIQAVRLLIGELGHFQGIDTPAVNFAPFGSARLERVAIGMI
jgi:hypothetical protein